MCVVWDINNFSYVRTLPHSGAVKGIAISPTLGHIYTLEQQSCASKTKSVLTLWSINGDLIATAGTEQQAVCLKASPGMPGVNRNFLAVGNEDGSVTLWDAHTLKLLRTVTGTTKSPITAIAFAKGMDFVYTGNSEGEVTKWSLS